MSQELMAILIELTRAIDDVNRAVEYSNRRLNIDSTDTDAISDNVACLRGKIYELARGEDV